MSIKLIATTVKHFNYLHDFFDEPFIERIKELAEYVDEYETDWRGVTIRSKSYELFIPLSMLKIASLRLPESLSTYKIAYNVFAILWDPFNPDIDDVYVFDVEVGEDDVEERQKYGDWIQYGMRATIRESS